MKAQELTFASIVQNGRVNKTVQEAIRRALSNLEGKVVKITLAERKKQRSLNQNAFYWGVVIPAIITVLRGEGNMHADGDLAHEVALELPCPPTGVRRVEYREKIIELRSSSGLNTVDWEEYVEQIRVWCAENGVQLPYPNEF